MLSVNKAILIGNLGRDPELRTFDNTAPRCSFPLATTERYKDRNGQTVSNTDWHNIVIWGKQGELAAQYLKKGDPVYIEGRIRVRSYDDREGIRRMAVDIVAEQMVMLGKRNSATDGNPEALPSTDGSPAGYRPTFGAQAANLPNLDPNADSSADNRSPDDPDTDYPPLQVSEDLPF